MIIYFSVLVVLLLVYGLLARLDVIDVDDDSLYHIMSIVFWPLCAIIVGAFIAMIVMYYAGCFLIYALTGQKMWTKLY